MAIREICISSELSNWLLSTILGAVVVGIVVVGIVVTGAMVAGIVVVGIVGAIVVGIVVTGAIVVGIVVTGAIVVGIVVVVTGAIVVTVVTGAIVVTVGVVVVDIVQFEKDTRQANWAHPTKQSLILQCSAQCTFSGVSIPTCGRHHSKQSVLTPQRSEHWVTRFGQSL